MNGRLKALIISFILSVALLPLIVNITTIFHELAHVNTASKYNVNLSYNPKLNYFNLMDDTMGFATPISNNDILVYNNLSLNSKRVILMAGINSDIYFIQGLALSLFFFNLLVFGLCKKYPKWGYFINLLILLWIYQLITMQRCNLFWQYSDLDKLVTNFNFTTS